MLILRNKTSPAADIEIVSLGITLKPGTDRSIGTYQWDFVGVATEITSLIAAGDLVFVEDGGTELSQADSQNFAGSLNIPTYEGFLTSSEVSGNFQDISEKDVANGYAGLDGSGLLLASQMPPLAITSTYVVANEAAQLALTVQEGDVAVRTDENKSYIALNDTNASLSDWQVLLTPPDAVLSVAGKTGVVVLDAADITSGAFADARISQSSVTQYEGAINHDALLNFVANEHLDWTLDLGATNINDANITQSAVTQHQAALSITESQISDLGPYNNYSHPNHTGEVTSIGDGAQALDPTAISNKTSVTAAATDEILIGDASDAGNLKKVTAQSIADLGGGSGGTGLNGLGTWRARTETAAPPASGQLRFNNANPELATELYLHETTDGGTDMGAFLNQLSDGDLIYIQDKSNSGNYLTIEISTNTDSGVYRTFGIELIEQEGAALSQNTEVIVIASGGGVHPWDEYAQTTTSASTSSTSLQTYLTLNFDTSLANEDIDVLAAFVWITENEEGSRFELHLDDTLINSGFQHEAVLKDPGSGDRRNVGMHGRITVASAGSHTLKIKYRSLNGATTFIYYGMIAANKE